jgi:hypothetical protein
VSARVAREASHLSPRSEYLCTTISLKEFGRGLGPLARFSEFPVSFVRGIGLVSVFFFS